MQEPCFYGMPCVPHIFFQNSFLLFIAIQMALFCLPEIDILFDGQGRIVSHFYMPEDYFSLHLKVLLSSHWLKVGAMNVSQIFYSCIFGSTTRYL